MGAVAGVVCGYLRIWHGRGGGRGHEVSDKVKITSSDLWDALQGNAV